MKIVIYFLMVIVTSMFFFPFEFTFLPGINTKMALAVVGLGFFAYRALKKRELHITKEYMLLGGFAALVSLIAFGSAVLNGTNDFTYADYIISMLVWIFGAFAVVEFIRYIHGEASVRLVCNYLIAVCVLQCILALLIDNSPQFKNMVNLVIADMGFVDQERLSDSARLYGIGCALDVAGTRFAAVLTMIAQMLVIQDEEKNNPLIRLAYIISFFFIIIIGNIISRTTIVGVALALVILLLSKKSKEKKDAILNIMIVGAIAYFIVSILYRLNPVFQHNIRFAFEGFFSIAEKGHWETHSNNILKEMIIFPESLKTWIIGDGYLLNPFFNDPNYIGQDFNGFYMQTDIGYLRFIFYFGTIGLLAFSSYMCIVGGILIKRSEKYKILFSLLLLLNFIIWFKVSTDIFLVYALFLCLFKDEFETEETPEAIEP